MGIFDKLFGSKKKDAAVPPPSSDTLTALMNEDRFWQLIQASKDQSGGSYESQKESLARILGGLEPGEIIAFANRFRSFRGLAKTWDLWGAIYIINGGCSDDSFNDFREWVIGQGKDFYYRTTANPESLADFEEASIGDMDWEGLGYIPARVYKNKTRERLPAAFREQHETTGDEWSEDGDELRQRFPRLAARYADNL